MFDRELTYFIDHQDELVNKFDGMVLLLNGSSVLGAFGTAIEAYLDAQKRGLAAGTFMLQPCTSGAAAYTVTLASHEVFG